MAVREGWQGRYFEDFAVGDVYRSRYGRTITETDNTWFTLLTNNTNQLHFSRPAAEAAGMSDCIVNSLLTLAVVTGLTVTDISENGINLGWSDVRFEVPVFPGDTLFAQSEILTTRESHSRPHMGVINVRTEGLNQHGACVMRCARSVYVWKRESAPRRPEFPAVQNASPTSPPLFATPPET